MRNMFSGMDVELEVEDDDDDDVDVDDEDDDEDDEDDALPAPTTEACVVPLVKGTLRARFAYSVRIDFLSAAAEAADKAEAPAEAEAPAAAAARSWTKRS